MTEPVTRSLLDQPDDPQRSVELTLPDPDDWPPPLIEEQPNRRCEQGVGD